MERETDCVSNRERWRVSESERVRERVREKIGDGKRERESCQLPTRRFIHIRNAGENNLIS